jgi:hypothetical protein
MNKLSFSAFAFIAAGGFMFLRPAGDNEMKNRDRPGFNTPVNQMTAIATDDAVKTEALTIDSLVAESD